MRVGEREQQSSEFIFEIADGLEGVQGLQSKTKESPDE